MPGDRAISVEEALAIVERAIGGRVAGSEVVPLAAAAGRVLAEDVAMDHDVPPFRRATMDGYAVRAEDLAAEDPLAVTGRVAAGEVPAEALRAGEAWRVMTGAPVPEAAGAVVPFEWTREESGRVRLDRRPGPGANIAMPGEHARRGQVVAPRGRRVTPALAGVLATAGASRVPVARRPSVAVLGTGSELVAVDETPGPGRIRNSNGVTLLAQAAQAGAAATDLGFAPDDEASLRAAVRRGLDADLLVLSGGVSRGDLDLVPATLEAEGVRRLFHRWAVQPGGPLWFGSRGSTLVFGLPGNPAASFVGFELLAVPAIGALLGRGFLPRRTVRVRFAGPFAGPGDRRRFRPVRLESGRDGVLEARAAPWRGSGDPFGLAEGDALVSIPERFAPPEAGPALVDAVPLGGTW